MLTAGTGYTSLLLTRKLQNFDFRCGAFGRHWTFLGALTMNIDENLLFTARRLVTGANVHYLNNLIFLYQQAVRLHNANHPRYRAYDRRFEDQLRSYVASQSWGQ